MSLRRKMVFVISTNGMASAAPPTSPFPASDSDAPSTAIAIALDDVGVSVKHSLDVKLAGRVTRWGKNATGSVCSWSAGGCANCAALLSFPPSHEDRFWAQGCKDNDTYMKQYHMPTSVAKVL